MKLKPLLFGAAVAINGCHQAPPATSMPLAAVSAQPDTDDPVEPKKPEKTDQEIFTDLRAEDKRLEEPLEHIRRDAEYKIHRCIKENAELAGRMKGIIAPLIYEKPEFAVCGPNLGEGPWWDCANDILIRQGKIRELIEFYRSSNELSRRVIDCANDPSRWDTALTQADYEDSRLFNHPDPDIRKLIEADMDSAPDSNADIRRLERKYGYEVVSKARWKDCSPAPEVRQCHSQLEATNNAFFEHPSKQTRMDQLRKSTECNTLVNTCIRNKVTGSGK